MKTCFRSLTAALILTLCFGSFTSSLAQKLPGGYINSGGVNIYVEGGGKGDAVIFVHAGFQDHRMWKYQVTAFMKDHMVLLIDLPGHGQTLDTSALPLAENVIRDVMDSLHISKASLVGLSLGGAVITDFAIAYPARVNKLVLASSGLTGWDEGRQLNSITKLYVDQLDSAFVRKDTAAAAEVFTQFWFDGVGRSRKDIDSVVRKQVVNSTYYTMKQHHASGWPRFASPTAINKLAQIKAPALVLTGVFDLPEILQMNTFLAKNIPNAKQVMIDAAAHMINLERPQRFNDEVRKFLNE